MLSKLKELHEEIKGCSALQSIEKYVEVAIAKIESDVFEADKLDAMDLAEGGHPDGAEAQLRHQISQWVLGRLIDVLRATLHDVKTKYNKGETPEFKDGVEHAPHLKGFESLPRELWIVTSFVEHEFDVLEKDDQQHLHELRLLILDGHKPTKADVKEEKTRHELLKHYESILLEVLQSLKPAP